MYFVLLIEKRSYNLHVAAMNCSLSGCSHTASTHNDLCIFYQGYYQNSEKSSKLSRVLIKLVIITHLAIFYKWIILEKGRVLFFLRT